MPQLVKIDRTVGEIWLFNVFQDCGRPPSWFLKFEILIIGRLKKVKMCHRVKFHSDPSNRCWDIAILFFQNGYLEFVMWMIGPRTTNIWWCLLLCKIWLNRYSSFDNMQVFLFTPQMEAPNGGFWGFYPIDGEQSHQNPQKTRLCAEARHMTYRSLRSVHAFLHSSQQSVPVLYNGPPLFPSPKIASSHGESGPSVRH